MSTDDRPGSRILSGPDTVTDVINRLLKVTVINTGDQTSSMNLQGRSEHRLRQILDHWPKRN